MVYSEMKNRKIPPSVDREDIVGELTVLIIDSLPRYDPARASFVTFVFHIIHRRMARMITNMSGARALEGGRVSNRQFADHMDILDESDTGTSLEDYELVNDAAALIKTHLNQYQRRVYLDYLQNIPTTVIAERANAYLDAANPKHKVVTNVDVNETIAECTEKIKEEFRQRGVIDTVAGELQKVLF
jgi:DNA-directed RNA polymerase specialized sigma24 family protein